MQNLLRERAIEELDERSKAEGADQGADADQAAQQEDGRHDRDDLLRDRGQTLYAAQEDDGADDDQDDTHDPGGDAESRLHGGADGVGLHHAAEEAECQRDGDGEEAGEELAEAALKGRRDVVDRTALDVAVLFDDAGLLGERRFRVDRGHAEKRDDPHPEHRPRPAGKDGGRHSHKVAGADGGR